VTKKRVFLALLSLAAYAGAHAAEREPVEEYRWSLPKGFPKPAVPTDNPMTEAKVELGRYLFYDTRMSMNGKSSCATCHKQELAFTDGQAVSIGTTGDSHSRSAMSLVNIAYSAALTWSNPQLTKLEEQALIPMYGAHPVELGLKTGAGFFKMFAADPRYRILFERAFPTAKIDSRSKTLLLPLRVLREASFLRGRRMTVIIIKATTTLCRTPPSAVRLCSSISTFRVFAVTVDSISAMPQFQKRQQSVQSTSTTLASII